MTKKQPRKGHITGERVGREHRGLGLDRQASAICPLAIEASPHLPSQSSGSQVPERQGTVQQAAKELQSLISANNEYIPFSFF